VVKSGSMIPGDEQTRALVSRQGEGLYVEMRRWLNPSDVAGISIRTTDRVSPRGTAGRRSR
jgi:hypothetical protein